LKGAYEQLQIPGFGIDVVGGDYELAVGDDGGEDAHLVLVVVVRIRHVERLKVVVGSADAIVRVGQLQRVVAGLRSL